MKRPPAEHPLCKPVREQRNKETNKAPRPRLRYHHSKPLEFKSIFNNSRLIPVYLVTKSNFFNLAFKALCHMELSYF
jgi:hypothetical protein